jgi:hypothetical protein
MEKYVTFEQAEKLKELGFIEPTLTYWSKRDGLQEDIRNKALFYENHNDKGIWQTSRPEQCQVVEWLLQAYKIDVDVSTNRVLHTEKAKGYIAEIYTPKIYIPNWELGGNHQNREEAYSAAFDYILKNNLI